MLCINYVNSLDTKCKLENDAEAFSEKRLELPSVPVCVCLADPLYTDYLILNIQLYCYTVVLTILRIGIIES